MKHPTQHLRKLRRSLQDARRIVNKVPQHGSTKPLHHLKVQALILLAHAALEEYLEGLGREAALKSREMLKKRGEVCHTLVALVASKLVDDAASEKVRSALTKELINNLDEFSKVAMNRYDSLLKSNNGITERDQKNILYPVGVDPEETDIALMAMLHSFAAKRGAIAHTFSMIRTEYTLHTILTDIKTMQAAMISYDKAVCNALMRKMASTP